MYNNSNARFFAVTEPAAPPAQPQNPIPPKVRWNDRGLDPVRPNVCNITTTKEEVTLLFGAVPVVQPGQEELLVELKSRVTLTPIAAKLLGHLIANAVKDYEGEHGKIQAPGMNLPDLTPPPSPSASPAPQPRVAGRSPAPLTPAREIPDQARLLFALMNGLRVPYAYEKSFKALPGRLLPSRYLLGINKSVITPELEPRVLALPERLGMPEALRPMYQEGYPAASFTHFGLEQNEDACLIKAYLEFSAPLLEATQAGRVLEGEHLLHRGFKWSADEPEKYSVASYRCFHALPQGAIRERLGAILVGPEHAVALRLTNAIFDLALQRISDRKLLYLEVTEEGNPRISFDLNLYAARLRMSELRPIFDEMQRHYSLPPMEFASVLSESHDAVFGHVSGGIDRQGRDFLTIYYGVEGRGP